LQAEGRRFEPDWLHQDTDEEKEKKKGSEERLMSKALKKKFINKTRNCKKARR
jgi:hypothetical protein